MASVFSKGIKYKLFISVSLMSVIPLLVCLNYIFPSFLISFITKANLAVIISIMLFMILLGITIIKQVFDSVVSLSRSAKQIAEGNIPSPIASRNDDEVGQLGEALNQLTLKIKAHMDEIKDYGSKTAQINLEIQKRIIVISGMLEISGLITRQAKLDEILLLCVEKIKGLADSSVGFALFLHNRQFILRAQSGLEAEKKNTISFSEDSECIMKIAKKPYGMAFDAKNIHPFSEEFLSALGTKNALCLPLFSKEKQIAILGVGNTLANFVYDADTREILDIFAKQVHIAIENDILNRRVEKLEIRDALTGLYNEQYIRNCLDEEIKRALIYQRPCAFLIARINNFTNYSNTCGLIAAEALLKKIAACLNGVFSGVERVGRFADYEFAIILPEKNKRQAQSVAGQLQQKVASLFTSEADQNKHFSINVAVAENPLDGVSSQELILCAQSALKK